MLQVVIVQLLERHTKCGLSKTVVSHSLPELRRLFLSAWSIADSLYFRGFCSHKSKRDAAAKKMWVMTRVSTMGSTNRMKRVPAGGRRKMARTFPADFLSPLPGICVKLTRRICQRRPDLIYRFTQADAVSCRWNCAMSCGCSSFYFCSKRQFSITV